MTLVDFLLARIADDEADARNGYSETSPLHLLGCATNGGPPGPFPCDCRGPARMLATYEAMRQIVAAVTAWMAAHPEEDHVPAGDDVLAWLALPYASHPGYLEEWRP